LAGSANTQLATRIAAELGVRLTPSEAHYFSDGNVFVRILENVRGRDCYVIQGVHQPVNDNFVELLFWIDALRRASAQHVTVVIPYFSYAKGDKKDEPRVSIRARACADCLEAVGVDRVLTMDLHAPQIQGFFRVPVDHLYAISVLKDQVRGGNHELVVVSPDTGFAERARQYARFLQAEVAVADKMRRGHDERAYVGGIIGIVKGKKAVIVDDFTITGWSLIETAEMLLKRGATEVCAMVTHGILALGAAQRIEESPIRQLLITDTIEHRYEPLTSKIQVVSLAPLLAEAIRSIHERTSVSRLFAT
jgi:ribose-phosphate pyrophosphokinase